MVEREIVTFHPSNPGASGCHSSNQLAKWSSKAVKLAMMMSQASKQPGSKQLCHQTLPIKE